MGEKGTAPKATPTYPELCCHTLQDLEILHSREKIPFRVSQEARRVQEEVVIPYWQGNSMRDLILREMTAEWHDAYEAGVFTEFMEQRSPGHTVLDDKIYRKGMLDFEDDIQASLAALDFMHDPEAYDKQEQLIGMRITARALIRFGERHAAKAREMAAHEPEERRKEELTQIAAICDRVPAHAPRSFWEALQYYWFVHLGVTTELNPWDAFNPGRLDQHLYPFYERELAAGSLTREAGAGASGMLLDQVQQPAGAAESWRDGRRKWDLYGFRPDQYGRREGRWIGRRKRGDLSAARCY